MVAFAWAGTLAEAGTASSDYEQHCAPSRHIRQRFNERDEQRPLKPQRSAARGLYLGVLAGHSSLRAEVVPKKLVALPVQLPLFDVSNEPTTSASSSAKRTAEPSRHPWCWLLQRVFAVDILKCEKCGGRLRLVEIAKKPDDISRGLGERGYARAPPGAELPLLAHGQLRLAFG